MAGTCQSFKGSEGMYGLGIRLGFYIQWLSLILCELLSADDPKSEPQSHSDVAAIRMANVHSLQLHLKHLGESKSGKKREVPEKIQDVDIYIVLLLCFGSSLFILPLFIWRALTRFDRNLDPTRWHTVRASQLSSQLSCVLLAAVSSFQIWFWTKSPDEDSCVTYVCFFGKFQMNSTPIRILHTVSYSTLLVLEVIWFILFIRIRHQEYRKRVVAINQVSLRMKLVYCLVKVVVAATVIIETELTISWNDIPDVSSLDFAGQTIPFVVSLFVLSQSSTFRSGITF
ncbi:unnamed protein product [Clonostachys rosea]|uniref:G-protein coupled receptors family 1 profile domain-containing protein n=1 Tax=Bionectria ochroleuca TaxID=29856 RepID=A0ABY6V298_BIOOC|nr:unnamed protein product [Clonostachys rosea]